MGLFNGSLIQTCHPIFFGWPIWRRWIIGSPNVAS